MRRTTSNRISFQVLNPQTNTYYMFYAAGTLIPNYCPGHVPGFLFCWGGITSLLEIIPIEVGIVNRKDELLAVVTANKDKIEELQQEIEACENRKKELEKELKELQFLQLWYLDQLHFWE